MKRGKKLLFLLLTLLLLVGATYAASSLSANDQQTEENETAATVFSLDAGSVTALRWAYNETIGVEKKDGQWVYSEDAGFPLNSTYIDTMLDSLTEVISYKTIEAVENWDQYTLEAPHCEVTVTVGGTTHTLKIGEETAMGGQRYFSTGDGNAYLVDSAILDVFSYGLYDLLVLESIPDMSGVTGMAVESIEQSYAVARQEDTGLAYSDQYVWFMDGQILDTELTEALLAAVTDMYWVECADYNAEDLSVFGLDTPDVVITVDYLESAEVATNETDENGNAIYETVEREEAFILEIGSEAGGYRYARIAGSQMVYKINASVAETLMYTTYYELQPDEVLLMDWDTVNAVDITLDGITYEIVKEIRYSADAEDDGSEETVYTLNGEVVDMTSITDALDNMASTGYATGLTPERAEEIRIMIHREHTYFPEVELVFYKYDSASCMTTLNGNASVFVGREAVVDLVEEVNALILQ